MIDLRPQLDGSHPPYAFAPRTWSNAVGLVDSIVERVVDEAHEGERGRDTEEASDVIGLAQELRSLLRPFV